MNRLENIDRLFAAVQLLSPDSADSNMLFREAFDGSLPDYLSAEDSDQLRRSFYAKLVSILRQTPQESQQSTNALSPVRARIRRDIFDNAFPEAFVQLKPGEQLLLFLTAIEGYDPDSIAEITGFETDHAGRQIESVFHKLDQIIRDSTSSLGGLPSNEAVPREWVSENLKVFAARYLDQPSPSIHRFIESRFSPGVGTKPPVPDAAAAATPQQKPKARKSRSLVASLITIFFTGLAAILAAQYFTPEDIPAASVFELSVEKASGARTVLPTSDAATAEQFIRTHFERVIMVPKLQSATLAGIGSSEVMAGRRVPTLIYEDSGSDGSIVVFGYSYAILRELSGVTLVGDSLLRSLEEPGLPVVEIVKDHPVVVWRVADDILFAVLPRNHDNPEGIL